MTLIYELYMLYTLCKNYNEYKKHLKELKDDGSRTLFATLPPCGLGLKLLFFINKLYREHLLLNKQNKPIVEYNNVRMKAINDKVEIIEHDDKVEIIEHDDTIEIIKGYTDNINNDEDDEWNKFKAFNDSKYDSVNSFDSLHMYID